MHKGDTGRIALPNKVEPHVLIWWMKCEVYPDYMCVCVCVCVFMDSWLSRTRMGLSTRVTFYFAAAFLCHLPARILSQGMCHVHCVRTYILLGILWRQ